MPIVIQSKGKQHCRDIKREACNFFYLTGGRSKSFIECIKMALEDHVTMLREEAIIMGKSKKLSEPVPVIIEKENPSIDNL